MSPTMGLDDVLHRDQSVGTAILVDDERDLDPRRLHLGEQVGGRHRRRHEQDRADQIGRRQRQVEVDAADVEPGRALVVAADLRPGDDVRHQVLDVDHADRIVEGLAVDRHARMAGGLEGADEVGQRNRDVDGIDVGPRHHDIVDPRLAETQDVAQHRPFLGREGGVEGVFPGKRVLEVFAEVGGTPEAEALAKPLEPSAGGAAAGSRTLRVGLPVTGRGSGVVARNRADTLRVCLVHLSSFPKLSLTPARCPHRDRRCRDPPERRPRVPP
jgi:hypothetical protein